LGFAAWEKENCDGVVFYHNYTAERFAARHGGSGARWNMPLTAAVPNTTQNYTPNALTSF
jgi:hypothetical protein